MNGARQQQEHNASVYRITKYAVYAGPIYMQLSPLLPQQGSESKTGALGLEVITPRNLTPDT